MTAFDFAALTIISLSLLLGLWRGAISEILAILVWICLFLSVQYGTETVSELLSFTIENHVYRIAGAMVAIAIAVLVVGAGVRLLCVRVIRGVGLGLIDRLLGAAFGCLRGVAILLILVLIGGMTGIPKQPWWRDALLAPPLETVVIAFKGFMPAELSARIHFH